MKRFLWIGVVVMCSFLFTGCGRAPEPETEADVQEDLENQARMQQEMESTMPKQ